MEKEPLFDSDRFKVMLGAILVEIGLFFADAYMVDVDTQVLQTIALAIAGLVASFIWGRTKRNTPSSDALTEAEWQAYLDSDRKFEVVGD